MPRLNPDALKKMYEQTQTVAATAKEEAVLNIGDSVADETKAALEKNGGKSAEEIQQIAYQTGANAEVALREQKWRVVLCLDRSGSFDDEYDEGIVTAVATRFAAIARSFDDDGSLDCYLFHDKFQRLPEITAQNYHEYIDVHVMKHAAGGTAYAPVINQIVKDFGGTKGQKQALPTYVIFLTDGDNLSDKTMFKSAKQVALDALSEASNYPIFWMFVGFDAKYQGGTGLMPENVARQKFPTLAALDDAVGNKIDNADFMALSDQEAFGRQEVTNKMFEEAIRWLFEARSFGMVA